MLKSRESCTFLAPFLLCVGGALTASCADTELYEQCERLGIPTASLESGCVEPVEVPRACEVHLEKDPATLDFSVLPEGQVYAYDESNFETIFSGSTYRSIERDGGATIVDHLGQNGCVVSRESTVNQGDDVIEHQRTIDAGSFLYPRSPQPESCFFSRTSGNEKVIYADDDCSCEPGRPMVRIRFDEAGRELKREQWTEGSWKTEREYVYDEEGRILERWRDHGDERRLAEEWSYDDQGRLLSRCVPPHYCETHEYEPFEGGTRETIVKTSSSSDPETTVRVTSPEGLPLSRITTRNGTTFYTKTWEWSADGLLLSSTGGYEGEEPRVLQHEYDAEGRLVSTDDTYGSEATVWTRQFAYDEEGFVMRRTDRVPGSEPHCEVTFDYRGSCEPLAPTPNLPAPLETVTGPGHYSDCRPYLD